MVHLQRDMAGTCSLLTKLLNVFEISMSHCFNAIWTCQTHGHCVAANANVSHHVTIKPIAAQHLLRVCTAGAVGQVSWSSCGMTAWATALTEGCEKARGAHGWNTADPRLHQQILRGQFGLSWGDGRGLGEWDRPRDIKEGSGFPCASALFLGDWNVLQEQHELPHSVMALPPGTVQACLTCS